MTYQSQAQREAATRERVRRFQMFARVFGSPEGREVLEVLDRLPRAVSIRPAEGSPIDPYQLAVLHGRRDVVQFIRDQIAAGEKSDA